MSTNGRCGPAFGNTACKCGVSCSKWNWCGTSKLHHSTKQAKYSNQGCTKGKKPPAKKLTLKLSKNGRCGAKFGNTACKCGVSCSRWNWCGTSKLHHSTKQAKYSNFNCGKKLAKKAAKKAKKPAKKAAKKGKKPAKKAPKKKAAKKGKKPAKKAPKKKAAKKGKKPAKKAPKKKAAKKGKK